MKRRALCLLMLLMIALPMGADAGLDMSSFEAFKAQALRKTLVHFPETSNAMWEKRSNNQLAFRCQLQNRGDRKTVAYELYIYTEDVWGNRLLDDEEVYTFTVMKKLEPEKIGYTEYLLLPNCKDIYKVYVGIKRVKYDDDVIDEYDTVTYYNWTVQ